MCEYCKESRKNDIAGKTIRTNDFKHTAGYHYKNPYKIDYLEIFILKGENDEKAGLMINNGNGFRYIDIEFCPFCGRKLGEQNE